MSYDESDSRAPKLSSSLEPRGFSALDDWTLVKIFEYLMVAATRSIAYSHNLLRSIIGINICPVTWPIACVGREFRNLSTILHCSAVYGPRAEECSWIYSKKLISLFELCPDVAPLLISKDIKYVMGTINGAHYLDKDEIWDDLMFKRDISNFCNLRIFSISICHFMTDASWLNLTISCPLLVILQKYGVNMFLISVYFIW